MDDNERTERFDHLFAEPVRETLGESTYGEWRSISAPDAAPLGVGFPYPESFPNDDLVDAADAVFDEEGDTALQYGGSDYGDQLVEAIVERARERGIDCDDDQVLLTNGGTNAVDAICRTFLDPGDTLFVEAPTFMGVLKLFGNFGVEVEGFPVDEDGLDVDAVARELEARREDGRELPTVFYTIPTFQNPTGTTLSLDRRERLLDLAAEYDFVVLEDDAYGDLRYEGDDVPTLAELDEDGRVVHVGTFSKTIAPGVRTGWVIAHPEIHAQVRRMNAGGTNTFTRGVLGRYCTDGAFEENLAELREAYAERLDHTLRCLDEHMPPEVEWTEPEGGFFVWVEFPEGADTDELLADAAEEGVVYLPGSMFFPDDSGENGLRLSFSFASLDEIDSGIEALARVASSATAEH